MNVLRQLFATPLRALVTVIIVLAACGVLYPLAVHIFDQIWITFWGLIPYVAIMAVIIFGIRRLFSGGHRGR